MSEYIISALKPFVKLEKDPSVYLLMLNATNIPPHFVLSIGDKIYGVGVKGATFDQDFNVYYNWILRKNIKTVLFKLKLPPLSILEDIKKSARNIIQQCPGVDTVGVTCLAPVKEFVTEYYSTNTQNVNRIFDLLPKLEEQGIVEEVSFINLEKEVYQGELSLKKYSVQDISEGIYRAQNKISMHA